jgi:hypothetical protein
MGQPYAWANLTPYCGLGYSPAPRFTIIFVQDVADHVERANHFGFGAFQESGDRW